MKGILLISVGVCFFIKSFAQESHIGNFKIISLGNGKTNLKWDNLVKKPKQISLQRSVDSSNYFVTVYSPENLNANNYSFTDFYPVSTNEVYYRLLYVTKDYNVLFSKSFSRSINSNNSLVLKQANQVITNTTVSNTSNKYFTSTIQKKDSITTKSLIKEKAIKQIEDTTETPAFPVFKGTKSNMPDTYSLKNDKNKKSKKNEDEGAEKEFNSKSKKERSKVIVDVINNEKKKIAQPSKPNKINSVSIKNEKLVVKDSLGTTKKNKQEDEFVVTSSKKNKDKKLKDSTEVISNKDTSINALIIKKDNDKNTSVAKTQINTGFYGAPGKITGKVINAKTGEPLNGATVKIVGGNTTKSIKTDYNGAFSFSNIPSGIYTLTCTFIGFSTNTIEEVKVVKDDVTNQDITMKESKGKDLDDVVVKSTSSGSRKNAETVNALLIIQKNAASVSDGISAETIKRTPDRNTSDILKRVSGASIQDDKFAIIRGLADRYNAVFLNSAPLPSTESDRKAFAFDIFPANMLDNLTIIKTATPDMPGEFAGGLILVNTKDIPSKDFQSVTFGLGYNTQATFRERKYYKGGRFDFIGLDDGTRALSANIPAAGQLPGNLTEAAQKNYAKNIANNWRTLEGINPMNVNFQYVKGMNIQKKGTDYLGVLLAATYSRSYNNTYGERDGYSYDRSSASQAPQQGASFLDRNYTSQVLAGFMANISMKINNNNRLSWKNILSINSDDKVITRDGTPDFTNEPERLSMSSVKWFTSNVILSSQLLGEHFLSKPKIKLNWATSYTSVNRSIPNLRRLSSFLDPNDNKVKQDVPDFTISPDNGGTMFFATTQENLKSVKLDAEKKLNFNTRFSIQLKAGTFIQFRDRDFSARYLGLRKYQSGSIQFDKTLLEQNEATIFDTKNFGKLKNGKGGFLLTEDYRKNNTYNANSTLLANYLMLDTRLFKFIRINGGLRVEQFNQKLNSYDDNNNKIALDSTITDVLPSANIIFSLNAKQNLRLGYSKTLNRPEYRELAPFIFYDYSTRLSIYGNPNIKRATIDNFDVRYEIYPGKGQLFSLSGFYKKIIDPIELVLDPNIDNTARYQNTPEAKIYGVELESRLQLSSIFKNSKKSIWEKLTVFGNLALIKSEINLGKDTILYGPNRALQGQSPYLFNAGIIFQQPNGFSVTTQINQVGQRIFVAGNIADMHIWENSRPVVDLQIAKILEKQGLEFKLNIKDILAKQLVYFFDVNDDGKYNKDNKQNLNADTDKIFSTINYGSVISASVTYKF